jgi:hypothetical protein
MYCAGSWPSIIPKALYVEKTNPVDSYKASFSEISKSVLVVMPIQFDPN